MPADTLIPLPDPWTPEDTQRYLTEHPLPPAFRWQHRDGGEAVVAPTYRLTGGYGKWLRETPYFQGLFEEIHAILARLGNADQLPTPDALATQLTAARRARGQQQTLPINPQPTSPFD